jgi:hypothetical protein
MSLFQHIPHPHIHHRRNRIPPTVADQYDRSTPISRFTAWLAVKITNGVGTMACAGIFTLIAMVSLPAAIKSGDPVIMVQWLSSVLLQLVLLSIILVGQRVQATASDQRALDTYKDVEMIVHEMEQLHAHLTEQDKALTGVLANQQRTRTRPLP